MLRLTLYSRHDCPLCDEMRSAVTTVGRGVPFRLEIIDVDSDPDLVAAYGDEVPVLCVNGTKAFAGRVDVRTLRARLERERS
jgi:glutaredoxin